LDTLTTGKNGEVWAYTGSGAPTRISQIAAGALSANPVGLTTINGVTYFTALASGENFELYKTDGATVSLVKEINTGGSNADPAAPYDFVDGGNGKVIFSAYTNDFGFEPWVSDGTSAGTLLLKDTNTLPRGDIGSEGASMGGWRYFAATDKDLGREVYRTNGTSTQLVSDIATGYLSSNPSGFVTDGTWVYFAASTINGRKLYRTNGTSTSIVGHIKANNISDEIGEIVATTSGTVFFTAINPDDSVSLRRVSGTTLTEVKNFGVEGGILSLEAVGNNVYANALDGSTGATNTGFEPWQVTTTGATLLGDLNPGTQSSSPREFVKTDNGDVYFAARGNGTGYELYKSAGGTGTPVQFIRTAEGGLGFGANGSNLTGLKALGNEVVFAAYTNAQRYCTRLYNSSSCSAVNWSVTPNANGGESLKIWRTDGTDGGTYIDEGLSSMPFVNGVERQLDWPSDNYIVQHQDQFLDRY
jgi:trimeric autotransporter adhesin